MGQEIYTDELGEKICEHIACGMSVAKAADEEHFSKASFFRILLKDAKLQDNYARAREARGHAHAESMDDIKGALLAGEIDAQTARVLMDATKWQAAHEKPKVYGERLDVTGIPAAQTNVLMPVRERIKRIRSSQGDAAQA